MTERTIIKNISIANEGQIIVTNLAAIAGGVTSFIDMPNTFPNVLTIKILNEK
jgi:dihydroorotase